MDSIPVLPRLGWKLAVECKHFTVDLPLDAEWLIMPAGDCADKWVAYKRLYAVQSDDFKWVPLSGFYDSPQAAQDAVKLFLGTKQPVFLNAKGEVATRDIGFPSVPQVNQSNAH